MTSGVVRAAGGVLWRPSDDGGVEVAVIHRPRYDDWSLPKGKADAGEHPLACALRATSGAFVESREVDRMLWLPAHETLRRIAGSRGTAALRRFHRSRAGTMTLLLVRNARATPADGWDGMEDARPWTRAVSRRPMP